MRKAKFARIDTDDTHGDSIVYLDDQGDAYLLRAARNETAPGVFAYAAAPANARYHAPQRIGDAGIDTDLVDVVAAKVLQDTPLAVVDAGRTTTTSRSDRHDQRPLHLLKDAPHQVLCG